MSDNASVTAINERAAEEFFKRAQEAEAAGSHEKAVEFYERALGENPDHELACFRLAVLYDRQADDAKAIELYERICTSPPVHLNALMNLAVLYEDNNHYDEARRCLDAILRTNPNHERARLYMKDVESARSMYYDEDSDRRGDRRNQILEIPLTDFELSVRSRNCLKKMNLKSLGDLLKTTEQELLSYKNFGETSLNEIKALLAQKGLRLGQAADESKVPARRPATPEAGQVPTEALGKNVSDLELSVRSRKALQRLNINTLAELSSRTEDELLGCKNFGQTSLNEIKQQLGTFGMSLRKLEQ
ncbi:MAG TPA: DNA-directed RNA polymerase subunit alpha C-terminal domain-containing protein [Tepidisphaeraceae bacterium]|jgi:DNA-directed RNA polymerase subunit alpha|nr:DNA-directed RNA polymerase subunit alpha C-terminal domain-containing protein [Tepidisphaeraceae bacterium]